MRVNYAIVFVSDMEKGVSFYRDVVGLPLKFESPAWTEFATGDATLALHATVPPYAGDATEQPGHCRPGIAVPDLDAFHRRMTERGVECVQVPTDLFGARIAQYVDPDGLPFSVAEDAPRDA